MSAILWCSGIKQETSPRERMNTQKRSDFTVISWHSCNSSCLFVLVLCNLKMISLIIYIFLYIHFLYLLQYTLGMILNKWVSANVNLICHCGLVSNTLA